MWASQTEQKPSPDAGLVDDGATKRHGGFRVDHTLRDGAQISFSGEVHEVHSGDQWFRPDLTQQPTFLPGPPYIALPSYNRLVQDDQATTGASLQGLYEGRVAGGDLAVLAYYEHSRINADTLVNDQRDTLDLDAQTRYAIGSHDVVLGAGIRATRDDTVPFYQAMTIDPAHDFDRLLSAFAHDEWTVVPDRLRLAAGVRAEKPTGDRVSFQPNVRFAWTPSRDDTVWGALAHAERDPSRVEESTSFPLAVVQPNTAANPGSLPSLIVASRPTDGTLADEEVDSAEIGWRTRIGPELSLDFSAFADRYRNLRSYRIDATDCLFFAGFAPCASAGPFNPPLLARVDAQTASTGEAHSHGFEASADWHVRDWWRVRLNYGYLHERGINTSNGTPLVETEGAPRNTIGLQSSWDIGKRVQLDARLRHLSAIPATTVPAYTELDLRVGWRPVRRVELALIGQNLLHARHIESTSDFFPAPTLEMARAVSIRARIDF